MVLLNGKSRNCPQKCVLAAHSLLKLPVITRHEEIGSRAQLGIAYRPALHELILENIDQIDVLEVNVDQYLQADIRRRAEIQGLASELPVVAHGVGLSLGTDERVNERYLDAVADVLDRLACRYYSEHIAFTRAGGLESGTLLPCRRDRKALDVFHTNFRQVKSVINTPILLENIAYYFEMSDNEMSEVEFITTLLAEMDCRLLLDLQNLFVNSQNHRYDPVEFIDSIVSGSVGGVHVAGGTIVDGFELDDHGHPVSQSVLDLLSLALERHAPPYVILERDNRIEANSEIREDIKSLHRMLSGEELATGATA